MTPAQLRTAVLASILLAGAGDDDDHAFTDCWGRGDFDRSDCCHPGPAGALAAAVLNCWDSVFTRKECCGPGRAALFLNADGEAPAWEAAARWASQHRTLAEKPEELLRDR